MPVDPPDDRDRDATAPMPHSRKLPQVAAEPEQPRLQPGTRLGGRYLIERFVASGGMGEVYEATDAELRTKLAVKTVRGDLASDPSSMERVRREVQLARTVTDPHVCRIFDIGHSDVGGRRITYITMELLEGATLRRRLGDHGPFEPAAALTIAADIVGGLEAVHRAGVIHRDLKPENVLLVRRDDREHAVLTDFGIARPEQVDADRGALTETGILVGSPAFMAPEQINGARLTTRTDLYALGALLWELVIGPWPLRRKTTTEIIQCISRSYPTIEDMPATVDPRWAAVIRRCRASDPEHRFHSARAVLDALTSGSGLAPAPPRRRGTQWAIGGVIAVAVAGGSAVAWRMSRSHQPHAAPTRMTLAAIEAQLDRLDHHGALTSSAAFERDSHDPITAAYLRARSAAGLGDWKSAAAAAKTAMAAAALPRAHRLELDAITARASGDLDGALARYEALATTSPNDPRLVLAYLDALIPLGRAELASQQLAHLAALKLSPVLTARVELARAWALYNTSGFDQAELSRHTDAAITAGRTLGAPVIVGRALCMRATAHVFQGRPDDAKLDAREAETLLVAAHDTPGLAFIHRVHAVVAANADHDADKQMAEARKANALYEQIDDNLGLALSLNLQGSVFLKRGEFVEAKAMFRASEAAAMRAHREDVANTRARPNLGVVFIELGKINDTIKVYLDLRDKRGPDQIGFEEGNLTAAYILNGKLGAAREHLAKSNTLLAATKNQRFLSDNISHGAAIAFEADDHRAYAIAMERALAHTKATSTGDRDFSFIVSTARVDVADHKPGIAAQLLKNKDAPNTPPFIAGELHYLAARALLAEGKRAEALEVRAAAAKDAKTHLQFGQVRLQAGLLEAELARTPAELAAAVTSLATLRGDLGRDGFTLGRWETELAMASLARRQHKLAEARKLANAVAQETRKAGYLRLVRLATTAGK